MSIIRRQARVVHSCSWLLGLAVIVGLVSTAAHARDSYTLAIVPQYAPITVYRNWRPMVEVLSEETGVDIKLRVYNSFNRFIGALERGAPDLVYLAPYHLVQARRHQNYIPLVRDGSRDLIGIVVVRKDSHYRRIEELDGKQIDFPSPSAFAASLYIRAHLREKLNIDYVPRYVGNHDNVYRHVAFKLAEGGGGVNTSLSQQPAGLRDQLRVLYEVPGVASHPIAAHERVPGAVRMKIKKVLQEWQYDPQRQALLKAIHIAQPVPANYERDYQSLDSLGLEKYLTEPGS